MFDGYSSEEDSAGPPSTTDEGEPIGVLIHKVAGGTLEEKDELEHCWACTAAVLSGQSVEDLLASCLPAGAKAFAERAVNEGTGAYTSQLLQLMKAVGVIKSRNCTEAAMRATKRMEKIEDLIANKTGLAVVSDNCGDEEELHHLAVIHGKLVDTQLLGEMTDVKTLDDAHQESKDGLEEWFRDPSKLPMFIFMETPDAPICVDERGGAGVLITKNGVKMQENKNQRDSAYSDRYSHSEG
eukprot:TRINITY_DN90409_c0_g1_i1.p1 TRINITY_DN90409_c0_g1~~TRINITY_DN90409_c0_g1_i1.p1  ORF type:complete len:240 (+),score=33.95 TRINITY_DN90409_c0_g1_i1:90-809(+)